MKDIVLKVENVSKQYRLGQVGTGTLSHDFNRWWHQIRGKENPYLKIGEANDRSTKGNSDYVWALNDINFEVERGEVLGIIGKNGAGKSTLLKLLSKVTAPTTGSIKYNGKIASLLEVGTGFHPDLTGRENIYLNGAILGMTKKEITAQMDAIIDFSGVERYIDTPVKRYSSGMYVRLAFAVAAHLESDILIVDEVLSVGDAEFQKKCMGKMNDISKGQGRTVLFVSHNMAAIQKLCTRAILMERGKVITDGKTDDVISFYLQNVNKAAAVFNFNTDLSKQNVVFATRLEVQDLEENLIPEIPLGSAWQLKLFFTVNQNVDDIIVAIGITDIHDVALSTTWSKSASYMPGHYTVIFSESIINYNTGIYKIIVGISKKLKTLDYIEDQVYIEFSDVIRTQDELIVNNQSGLFSNQMNVKVECLSNLVENV